MLDKVIIFASLLVLSACSTTSSVSGGGQGQEAEQPVNTSEQESTNPTPTVGASALELLEVARQQAEAGQGDLAASTLERALKIEPDNPWLWHRLAVLRMQQKNWAQAIELANRSIALAKGNNRLIGGNWLVISLSLEGAGSHEASAKAKKNSDVYLGKD